MKEATTKPYVKSYNEKGELINDLKNHYWDGTNRRNRKEPKVRMFNNSRNFPLFVHGKHAFHRHFQIEFDKQGRKKIIQHLVSKN